MQLILRRFLEAMGIQLTFDLEDSQDRFPGTESPIVVQKKGQNEVILAQWGLVAQWHRDATIGPKSCYNAKSETLEETPSFSNAYRRQRCIIPVSAFFEQDNGRWLAVSSFDGQALGLAGLYEPAYRFTDKPTFTIVTTSSNNLLSDINDRMPVILSPKDFDTWLDPKATPNHLEPLMVACDSRLLNVMDAGPNNRRVKMDSGQTSLFD